MPITLAFDVYGTLIDIYGANKTLEKIVGNKSLAFSHTWRDKQLEYSFRKALMNKYEVFSVCVSEALDYTCMYYKTPLTKEEKKELLNAYSVLPAFNDVIRSLKQFNDVDYKLYAFSNGSVEMVESLLAATNIREYFQGIISVDGIKSFKPDPAVYQHFISETGADNDKAWLVSSNPFDVIGAVSAGMKAAWVKRFENKVFDPWGIEPTLIINSLNELKEKVDAFHSKQ